MAPKRKLLGLAKNRCNRLCRVPAVCPMEAQFLSSKPSTLTFLNSLRRRTVSTPLSLSGQDNQARFWSTSGLSRTRSSFQLFHFCPHSPLIVLTAWFSPETSIVWILLNETWAMKEADQAQSENRVRWPNYFPQQAKMKMIWTKVTLQHDPWKTTIRDPQEFQSSTKSKNFNKLKIP